MAKKEFFLIWTKDSGEEETISIRHEMIFGRKKDCDMALPDQLVSGKHFQTLIIGQKVYLSDLNSFNKTFLNEVDLSPEKKTPLKEGDVIKAGKQTFTFTMNPSKPTSNNTSSSNVSLENDSLQLKIENLKTEGLKKDDPRSKDPFLNGLFELRDIVNLSIDHAKDSQYDLSKLSFNKDPNKTHFQEFKDKKEKILNQNKEVSKDLKELINVWKSFF